MTDTEITFKGDPDECMKCGRQRSVHTGILKDCPGSKYGMFASKFLRSGLIDVEHTKTPVCPNCGYIINDWYDYGFDNEDDVVRIDCGDCETEFDVHFHIQYSFSSSKIDHDAEKIAEDKRKREWKEKQDLTESFEIGASVKCTNEYASKFNKTCTVVGHRQHNIVVQYPNEDNTDWLDPEYTERV